MSSLLPLTTTLIVLLISCRLVKTSYSREYRCPSCGARSADRHGPGCSWRQ